MLLRRQSDALHQAFNQSINFEIELIPSKIAGLLDARYAKLIKSSSSSLLAVRGIGFTFRLV